MATFRELSLTKLLSILVRNARYAICVPNRGFERSECIYTRMHDSPPLCVVEDFVPLSVAAAEFNVTSKTATKWFRAAHGRRALRGSEDGLGRRDDLDLKQPR